MFNFGKHLCIFLLNLNEIYNVSVFISNKIYKLVQMSKTYNDLKTSQTKFSYDTTKYNFVDKLNKIFDNCDLPVENIHNFFGNDQNKQVTIDDDTRTKFHQKYYKSEHYNEMIELYQSFVKNVVLPVFNCEDIEFIVQKEPSFRVCPPNNTALGFRPNMGDPEDKVGLHCDSDYGHPEGEINFILTFGNQYENNSCYVETMPNSNNFVSLQMKYGEFIGFYGNRCRHFNKVNDTGISRVSIDFRVMPLSKYDFNCVAESLHSKRKFLIGDYYIKMSRI